MKRILQKSILLFLGLSIISCSKQVYTADIDTSYYRINNYNPSDDKLDELIEPYKVQLDSKMNEVIAYNVTELSKDRPNSALGNWFSDVLLTEAERIYGNEVDMSMQNYGGIRVPSLRQGDITVGNIYELMPFDNKLVVLTMDGELLQQLLDRVAERGGWPISHTLKFTIDNQKATKIMIKGEPISMDKLYTVALADYIADGGDDCFFLEKAQRADEDIMIRDLIITHLRSDSQGIKKIEPDNLPRISTYKM